MVHIEGPTVHTELRKGLEPEREGQVGRWVKVRGNPAAGGCCPKSEEEVESRGCGASARGTFSGNETGES